MFSTTLMLYGIEDTSFCIVTGSMPSMLEISCELFIEGLLGKRMGDEILINFQICASLHLHFTQAAIYGCPNSFCLLSFNKT